MTLYQGSGSRYRVRTICRRQANMCLARVWDYAVARESWEDMRLWLEQGLRARFFVRIPGRERSWVWVKLPRPGGPRPATGDRLVPAWQLQVAATGIVVAEYCSRPLDPTSGGTLQFFVDDMPARVERMALTSFFAVVFKN